MLGTWNRGRSMLLAYRAQSAATDSASARADLLHRRYERAKADHDAIFESRARWIRCFNRLEKAVTNHIDNCIDADDLAHVHKVVMRDLGPSGAAPPSSQLTSEEDQ